MLAKSAREDICVNVLRGDDVMQGPMCIESEIGRLRRVLVHTPGAELLAVTPSNRNEFLYGDLLDMERARDEHRRFKAILQRFAAVHEVRHVLEEALGDGTARNFIFQRAEEMTGDLDLATRLSDMSLTTLVQQFIEGSPLRTGPFSSRLQQASYVLPPLPNLFFTRDAAVVIGRGVVISNMRYASRWPEEALLRTIFGFHPDFAGAPVLYDGSASRRRDYSIEGGDIHPLSPHVCLVGLSERTTPAALDVLSDELFAQTDIEVVIGVVLPPRSTAIHLDMVWTQVDRGLCAVYQPMFDGPTRVPVVIREKQKQTVSESTQFFKALAQHGIELEPIFCGGPHPTMQEREQWASGCNFFAVAPGQVLSYSRNEFTLEAMVEAGFRLVDGDDFLVGKDPVAPDDRVVITFAGAELVRGGGGARCMTCPLVRDSLS